MSWSEAKWIVDQLLQKTGQTPNNMRAFRVFATSETSLALQFLEPADSYDAAGNLICTVGGVMVRMSTDGYPASVSDGMLVIDNTVMGAYVNTPFPVTGLEPGTKYYFSAFPYSAQGVFNLSKDGANRGECVPVDVEQVKVEISVDDSSGFTSVAVRCVNETNPAATQAVTLTAVQNTHTFTVYAGDTYHIEYGLAENYSRPENTVSKTAAAGTVTEYTGAYAYFTATIAVSYPAGSELTCTCGDTSYRAADNTGSYLFRVHRAGVWTVRITNGSKTVESSVVISASGDEKSVALTYFAATIDVTCPRDCVLTCSDGETVMEGEPDTGSYQFVIRSKGTWTVKISNGTQEVAEAVSITRDGQAASVVLAFTKIYGVSHDIEDGSTSWTRTDDAVGMKAVASVGTSAGRSDFDECYPWSEMKRETLSTGDVMVKIPEFWYQRIRETVDDQTIEHIRIADRAIEGFEKHPGSGRYVGAYKTSGDNQSVSGAAPTVKQTRATMRINAKSKGIGWGLIDAATNSALQMLFMVEFASTDGQATIGRGYCDKNSAALKSGTCDDVPNLTGRPAGTDGKVDVVYRGVEGIWGNLREWLDGVILKTSSSYGTGNFYVSDDPNMYGDSGTGGYTDLECNNSREGYIQYVTLNSAAPWAMFPKGVALSSNGSDTSFYPDRLYYYAATGGTPSRSGYWDDGSGCGLFYIYCCTSSALSGQQIKWKTVSRSAILQGKAVGGSTNGTLQGDADRRGNSRTGAAYSKGREGLQDQARPDTAKIG